MLDDSQLYTDTPANMTKALLFKQAAEKFTDEVQKIDPTLSVAIFSGKTHQQLLLAIVGWIADLE